MRFRCYACGPAPHGFEWSGDPVCPRCNRVGPPVVQVLVDVHLMLMDPKGPIYGRWGRQLVACQPKRAHLALHSNDTFAASDDPRAVTCPACRRTPEWQAMAAQLPDFLV